MAVQKSKVTRSRRGKRRSHDSLKSIVVQVDNNTGNPHKRHNLVEYESGFYRNGKQVSINAALKQASDKD